MNDVVYHIWQLTTVALSAQLTVLPLSLLYFHQIPVYFILTGFVVVDAAFIILGLGIILLVIDFIFPPLAGYIGILLDWVLWLVNSFIFLIQKIPYGLIEGIYISSITAVLMYLIIWQIGRFWEYKKEAQAIWGMSFLLILCAFYSFREYKNFETKQVVVYDAGKENTVIDFIFDKKIISLTSQNISAQDLKYNVDLYRKSLKINNITTINIDTIKEFKSDFLLWKKPLVQFFDQRIAILENDVEAKKSAVKADFVLLRNNPKTELNNLKTIFDFNKLIVDASNKFWIAQKWKEECQSDTINLHDVKKDGAYIVDLD